jgi:putative flippase GtrA
MAKKTHTAPSSRRVDRLRQDKHFRQLVKFGLVGGTTTIIYLGILSYFIYHDPFGIHVIYPIAITLAFVPATLYSYFFNRRWTFRAGRHRHQLLAKFSTIQTLSFMINFTVVAYLIEKADFETDTEKFIAAVIGNAFIALTNFLGNKFWTFKS